MYVHDIYVYIIYMYISHLFKRTEIQSNPEERVRYIKDSRLFSREVNFANFACLGPF